MKVKAKDRKKLERALCTLADYEGEIKEALRDLGQGGSDWDLHRVCDALRLLVDGEEG